jgi:uncharacterized protein (DUF2235 family)
MPITQNSNIVELFTMLKKDDRTQQMVYYQAGIGTYTSSSIVTPLGAKISKVSYLFLLVCSKEGQTHCDTCQTLDEAVAWNLAAHVMG